jgi:DNA mismatch repair ATPase MutS
MVYLIFGGIVLIVIILILHLSNRQAAKFKIDRLRHDWGEPKNDSFNFNLIGKYADTQDADKFHNLTDQTLDDIDFFGLFAFIDRTTSKVGQQFLFRKLLHPSNAKASELENWVELFSSNVKLREDIQTELLRLDHSDAYHIPSLLKEKILERPKWLKWLVVDIAVIVGLIVLSFQFPLCLILLLIPFTVNSFLHYWNKGNTLQFSRAFPQLNLLINVSKVLKGKDALFSEPHVEEHIANLKTFQQNTSLISFDNGGGISSELAQLSTYLLELFKAFLLIEVFTLYRVTRELETKQTSVLALFNYVGKIDTAISIASLRSGSSRTCLPVLIPASKEMTIKNMYHPFIEDCVVNSISINGKSILITGSNMSGKSTFLRTLIINSVLAQTINTCFADEFTSPVLKQFSSIRIDDNLFQGRSYYFQEVKIMGSIIEEVNTHHQNLFVLDEVFKGTNTVERIATAKAILSYLNRGNNIVIVSTHDIELPRMLESEYDLYHFTETIENNQLHFDYKIKAGQLKTRNAIKILELSKYPKEIINEAQQISNGLIEMKRVD